MRVKDLKIDQKYFSKSHQLIMEYCGVEYFQGYKYHNFYEPTWRLFHWLLPQDVTILAPPPPPHPAIPSKQAVGRAEKQEKVMKAEK